MNKTEDTTVTKFLDAARVVMLVAISVFLFVTAEARSTRYFVLMLFGLGSLSVYRELKPKYFGRTRKL
jgi:hypothetical protein